MFLHSRTRCGGNFSFLEISKKQKILNFLSRIISEISKFNCKIGNVGVYVKRYRVKQV